jgi:hypothetical protein
MIDLLDDGKGDLLVVERRRGFLVPPFLYGNLEPFLFERSDECGHKAQRAGQSRFRDGKIQAWFVGPYEIVAIAV